MELPYFPQECLLTGQEKNVVACIYNGLSNKEAARKLGISPRTIEDYRAHAFAKLGVKHTALLVRRILGDA